MSEDRIEVTKAKNGYQIKVYKEKVESKNSEVMYPEPELFVANDKEEALEIVKDNM